MEMEQSKVVDVVFGLSGVFGAFCGKERQAARIFRLQGLFQDVISGPFVPHFNNHTAADQI
jgi:hypothetical protein